jgi:CelD/BcsL family acetyltransferase involved in cellulose biosynthesis
MSATLIHPREDIGRLPAAEPAELAELEVDVVRSVEGVAALQPEYDRLQTVTGNSLPFALHDWHLVWCRHFLNRRPDILDEPMFHVMRNRGGECVAILPLILSRRRAGPLRIAFWSLLGADPAITEIRAPMVATGYELPVVRAVHERLDAMRDADWVQWTGMRGPMLAALSQTRAMHWQPSLTSYVLNLAPSWTEFRAGLKHNMRESLRHCYNSLKRDGLGFEFKVAIDPPAVKAGLHKFLELHIKRAEMLGTVSHPNRYAGEFSRHFLYAVCERLAARGVVRLFQLVVGGEIVAVRIGFVVGNSLYLYNSGFDPRWAKYSVMTTTDAEAIKYAIENELKTVNLSTGTDRSKTRWGPQEVDYYTAYECNRRHRSRLALYTYLKVLSGEGFLARRLQQLIPARRVWN